MPFVLTVGRHRRFAPSWLMTALTLALIVAFVAAGRWQWARGVERSAQWQAFERADARGAEARGAAVVVTHAAAIAALPRFARIAVAGRYDAAHQFLLDNRTRDGRAGYEVLTPLVLEGGDAVLVNRGWVPFTGFRERLPDVALPSGEAEMLRTVTGRLDSLPVAGIAAGRAPPAAVREWPLVTSYPQMAELVAALGRPLAGQILLLDEDAPLGFARAWRPPGMAPQRHFSYAVQWWSFAVAVVVLYVVLNLRRVER